ncbi:hypothetical protein EG328_009937 [Venturia inaequalis]|uniref:Uncharacterized protein n=1 Tax=Venturia inaequalis TaxID=5025 RepID=A0A8H3V8S6_VENIN|nr:hypothetical protein EG328_009937 [Venturia inaequalis]
MMGLLYFETDKATTPSTLLITYLLFSVLFDAAQIRTLWLAHYTSIAAVQTASVAVRTCLLVLEAQSKASYLRLPYRDYPPEAQSGIFNTSFVWWLNQLFIKGFRKLMTTSDLFALHPKLSSEILGKRLKKCWNYYGKSQDRLSLPKAVLACLKWDLLAAVCPRLLMAAFRFAQPFLITSAINYIQEPGSTTNRNHAYGLIGATFLTYLGISISTVHFKQCFSRIISKFRGSMISLIYDKTLAIEDGLAANSAALTLMSTDVDNIIEFLENIFDVWARVLEVAVVIVVLACFSGQTLVAKTIGKDQQKWNQAIQTRVKNTSHMLSSLKAIKISGYADVLRSDLQDERRQELKTSGPFFMGIVWLNMLAGLPAIWSPAITFVVFAVQASIKNSQSLTTVQIFTSLSIITLVTSPAEKLLALLPQISAAMGCFKRIQDYLLLEPRADHRVLLSNQCSKNLAPHGEHEIEKSEATDGISSTLQPDMVRFENATIYPAHNAETAAITDASFTVPKSSVTILVGPVGAGKTTLLKAILGEISCRTGSVSINSASISFCSQASFIVNDTVKQNVCGPSGLDLDEDWYRTVMNACNLMIDVQRWSDGDNTVVGSKGLKISGGQRQRLALARAIYARRDLILLDDTMSALDVKTQALIIKNLFSKGGILRQLGTTVVWATHSTRNLPLADQVIFLDRGGKVTTLANSKVLQDSPSEIGLNDDLIDCERLSSKQTTPESSPGGASDEKLMDLTRLTGDSEIYFYYFRTIGWFLSISFLLMNAVAAFTENFPQIWLKWWVAADGKQLSKYLPVYVILALSATASAGFCIWIVFLRMMPKSAAQLHRILLDSVIDAPLSFIASVDSGVTLNRFSQDMSLVDLALPIALSSFVMAVYDCLAKVALIATGSTYMAITLPFTFVALFFIQHIYLRTSRQLRYLDLENKSPLYSHLTETLEGLTTIRAFGWETFSIAKQTEILDHSQKPYYMLLCVQRWLNLVLDLMVTALAVIVVTLAVNLRASTSAGLLGIALNNIISFNQSLSSLVNSWTSLETSLGAIARVKSFAATTPSENKPTNTSSPPPEWPTSGAVEFRNISVQYNSSSHALKDLSMSISPGQKIGICGRTGSGKSTLISALLGLLPPSTGSISIDGINITTLRPSTLRNSLIAIPQDPFTTPDTIRSTIDPHGEHPDTTIISITKDLHIWTALESRGGLDATLSNQPLSQGEQQLLCLSSALLRKSRVLILDEATGSLDDETERVVRRFVGERFVGCTVFWVAHRLETILSSDKIAVLDAGELVEFDSPNTLLANGGFFSQLYQSQQRETLS